MAGTVTVVGFTEALAKFVADTPGDTLPLKAVQAAENAFVDTVGVAIAATHDDTVRTLPRALDDGMGLGPSHSWVGSPSRPPAQMALVNGTAAHALDFDDASFATTTHPSAVLCPAAMAVGQEVGASGRAVLEAYAVGYQVQCWVAEALGGTGHYAVGWHATASIGVMGAAATSARLYGLDARQTASALGVAGSMAGGSRSNFGTMTKPLHAGMAAARGVEAARLARVGFTANADMLEAASGYLQLFRGAAASAVPEVAEGWALAENGLSIKRYPACYATQSAIDAVLDLPAVDPDAVESVHVRVNPSGLRPLIHHQPTAGLQGKFSLEYTVAAALVDRAVELSSFTDDAVRRPQVQALLRRVRGEEVPVPPVGPPEWSDKFACVTIRLSDGSTVEGRRDLPRGHVRSPLTQDEIREKFLATTGYAGHPAAEILYKELSGLRDIPDVGALRIRPAD
jgi:2-methylcitrate dehydratase PrpD